MSEAEQKWKDFDLHVLFIEYSKGASPAFEYFGKSREAYKQALREDIENRISDCMIIVEDHDMANDQWLYSKAEISAFKKVFITPQHR